MAVYRWLLDQGIAAEPIAFAGDSAGGWLAITVQLRARRAGPAAARRGDADLAVRGHGGHRASRTKRTGTKTHSSTGTSCARS